MADWYFRNNQGALQSCPGCRNLVRANEEFCPYCARRLRPEGGMRGLVKRVRSMPFIATKALLGLIVLFFLLQMVTDLILPNAPRAGSGIMGLGTSKMPTYTLLGSNFNVITLGYGQYWRLLTYCFLHFGFIHIFFNGYAFWDLGRLAERLWGGRQVFATFILTGVVGGLASAGWNMLMGQGANSAGASGAICGMLGLLIGAYYRNKYHLGEQLGSQLIRWAVIILAMGILGGFDNAAHLGGMLSGGALGYFLPPTRNSRTPARDTKIWTAAAILALVLMLAAFGFMAEFYISEFPGTVEYLRQRY